MVRFNASGTILWERLFGRLQGEGQEHPTYEYGRRIYENADGSFTVTGVVVFSHIGIDYPYHGYKSGLILNISSGGALQSHYVVAGSYLDGPKNEVYKTNDGAYIVGITHAFDWYTLDLQRYSATGELIWTQGYYTNDGETNRWFGEHSIAEVADGYLVSVNVDNGRFQILKTDFDGNVAWQKRFKVYSDGTGAYPTQIMETGDGGSIVPIHTGYSTTDQVLLKTDASGDMDWANFYDGHYMRTARPLGGGFAVAANAFDFLFARLNGSGFLDRRCSALDSSARNTVQETAPATLTVPGKGPITCNAALDAGTWAAGEPVPNLDTGLFYHEVDACIPKLTVNPSPVVFYDLKVGLTSTANVDVSNYYGLGDATMGQLSLTDTSAYTIQADACSGQTISHVNFPPIPTTARFRSSLRPHRRASRWQT